MCCFKPIINTFKNSFRNGFAIAMAIAITAIAIYIAFKNADPNSLVAWVQAIGIIAAIIFAILATIFQSERNLMQAQQLKQEKENKDLQKIKELISFCFKQLEKSSAYKPNTTYNPMNFKTFCEEPKNKDIHMASCQAAEYFRSFSDTLQMVKNIDWKDYITESILQSCLFFSQMATNYMEQIIFHAKGAGFANQDNAPQQLIAFALFTDIEFNKDYPSWIKDLSEYYEVAIKEIDNYLASNRH